MVTRSIISDSERRRPAPAQDGAKERQSGIDGFRYLLCFSVALLHSMPSELGYAMPLWMTVIANGCRNAVPFFFIASGYFMRVPTSWTIADARRPVERLLPVYVCWYLIYALLDAVLYHHTDGFTLRNLVTGGTAFHLWFLPILCISLLGLPAAIILLGGRATAVAATMLALLGLAFGPYREVFGVHDVGAVRLTMAPLLVLAGYYIKRSGLTLGTQQAGLAVAVTFALLLIEEALIAHLSGSPFGSHAVAIMTYPFGIATFLFAKSLNSSALLRTLAPLGAISLGIYAGHLLFVRIVAGWIGLDTPVQAFVVAATATILATAASVALDRVPMTRRLVR